MYYTELWIFALKMVLEQVRLYLHIVFLFSIFFHVLMLQIKIFIFFTFGLYILTHFFFYTAKKKILVGLVQFLWLKQL